MDRSQGSSSVLDQNVQTSKAPRDTFYPELQRLSMAALWPLLADALTPEPRIKSTPHLWRWRDVRPNLLRSGELVTAEEAERRVLLLQNPGLDGRIAVTATLAAGIQLILPGEIARTHRHTPSAIRFIIEGEGGYTTVGGEKAHLSKGDFLTTPLWMWHDHGNEGSGPVVWLDGADLPLVAGLDAVFAENCSQATQPVTLPVGDSIRRWGTNLRPTYQEHVGDYSPVFRYPWTEARAALDALRGDSGSPFDGVILEYSNLTSGGSVLPTISAYLQLLRAGEHTRAHRHVPSTLYHVAKGGGFSVVAGQRFEWEEGDTFVVPAWTWHEHASTGGEAVLFSFSDRPVLRALGLDREQELPGYQ